MTITWRPDSGPVAPVRGRRISFFSAASTASAASPMIAAIAEKLGYSEEFTGGLGTKDLQKIVFDAMKMDSFTRRTLTPA